MNEGLPGISRLDVLVSPAEFDESRVAGRGVVVIDVLRATTVIARALAAGVTRIVPAGSVEAAFELKRTLGGSSLIGGERGGRRVQGFDLGNSPLEYSPAVVGGRTLILASTNGTVLLARSAAARRVVTASFNNAAAVARLITVDGGEWTIVASGKLGRSCIEDVLCAGRLAARIERNAGGGSVNRTSDAAEDGLMMALALQDALGSDVPAALASSSHGRYLASIGFEDDLDVCAECDILDIVPELRDGFLIPADVPAIGAGG